MLTRVRLVQSVDRLLGAPTLCTLQLELVPDIGAMLQFPPDHARYRVVRILESVSMHLTSSETGPIVFVVRHR